MPRRRLLPLALVATLVTSGSALAQAPSPPAPLAPADRPAGNVFTWSHELNQNEHPRWSPRRAPAIAPRPWFRIVDGILAESGQNGLWFSGVSALPFPPLPLHPREPDGWRTHARFSAAHRATGLSWDVNVEVWPARRALQRGRAVVVNPRTEAHTRRLSLIDPAYRAESFREIRRLVPRYRDRPYVNSYTGSDEPIVFLPTGREAVRSAYAKRLTRDVRREFGKPPPRWNARPTRGAEEGLRWLAYSRYVSDRFFDMKQAQARLIRRLDPDAVVNPNDYGFIDGFLPWDYTRLGFADVVEADPYVSFAERARPGRGRYNPGFGAKLLGDLTSKEVRIVVQAFPYAGYRPRPGDLYSWSAQALRAGATDVSFFAAQNPRFRDRPLYDAMLAIARDVRGTRLPGKPVDPSQLVVYATASEGQAQPHRTGGARYRTSADELYSAYAHLGEHNAAAFRFDADTRLRTQPGRLAGARTVWLPRADTLDPAFARALAGWVRAGGTLVVTDPEAFTRTPSGSSLRAVRDELIGAPLGPARGEPRFSVAAGAIGPGLPAAPLSVPVAAGDARAFAAVPPGAGAVATFADGAPAVISRSVGAGRVVAFASEVMTPANVARPAGTAELVAALHAAGGGTLGHPAWSYRLPGDPDPTRAPWRG